MKSKEIEIESTMEMRQAIDYLEELVASLKTRRVHLERGEDALTLSPQSSVKVKIRAESGKDKEAISLKLSWKIPVEPVEEPPAPVLKISSNANDIPKVKAK